MSEYSRPAAYPGIEKVGWIMRGSIPAVDLTLVLSGVMSLSIPQVTINWLDSLSIPLLSTVRKLAGRSDICQSELEFKVSEVDFPPDCLFVAVDVQGTAHLVGGVAPHYGALEIRRHTSSPGGEAVCHQVKYTVSSHPRRIKLT